MGKIGRLVEPSIAPADPWANDVLERRAEGEALARLIGTLSGSYVIALKGRWGTGKTVFLKRLARHLENQGSPVIELDAWRNDYLEDPLLALVAATKDRLEREKGATRKAAGKLVTGLAKHGAKLVVPIAAVAGAFVPGSIPAAVTVAAASTEAIGTHLLEWEKGQREAASEFRNALIEIRDGLTKGVDLPVVVIVDELDRCRPDFAVRLLERAKHYFDVPGIVFVIASDGTNLPSAIGSLYGHKVDGETYLRKFFDFEFELQEPNPHQFVDVLFDHSALAELIPENRNIGLYKAHFLLENQYGALLGERGLDIAELLIAFPEIAAQLDLSLRDQAQAFNILNGYLRSLPTGEVTFPIPVAFCVCLRFSHRRLYDEIRLGRLALNALMSGELAKNLKIDLQWLNHSDVGAEITFFAAAAAQHNPNQYLSALRNSMHETAGYEASRAIASTRILVRFTASHRQQLDEFLPKALAAVGSFNR